MGVCPENDPDLTNRDPNNLNENIKVAFEDVFGEPEGAHSADCVFKCAYKCFEGGKNLCYMILTFLCAVPIALCWGCQFACVACENIWMVTPSIRMAEITCSFGRKMLTLWLQCLCAPICETCGLIFSKIEVTNKSG